MHNFKAMGIGELAAKAGCSVPTVRYYEQIGLLPKARRRASGHRVYDESDLERLTFVRRSRAFGFTIEQVRQLAGLIGSRERDCVEVGDIAREHLRDVRRQLNELHALERSLAEFTDDCVARCAGGAAQSCVMLAELSQPERS